MVLEIKNNFSQFSSFLDAGVFFSSRVVKANATSIAVDLDGRTGMGMSDLGSVEFG